MKEVPNFTELKREIWQHDNREKYIATKNGTLRLYQTKWHPGDQIVARDANLNDFIEGYITDLN